jgi:uncharacterized protein YtpQ (UPF0354 family)
MSASDQDFCKRAIAYLKPSLLGAEPVAELSELDAPVITDLRNGLLVAYLVDQGGHFRYVQGRHLADANLTKAALHQSAINNLATLLRDNGAKVQPYGEVFAVFFGGNFEASLILIDALWDEHLADLAPNGHIIAIPNRDILAFCDAKSAAGLEELRQIVQRAKGGDHPITSTLYRRIPSLRTWQPYAN